MARRWIAWAGVLTAALAFQIFAPAPLSGFPLLLTLLLPLFSLGISLPGMLRCALTLACPAQSVTHRPRKSSLAAFNRRPPVEGLVQCILHALVGAGLQAAVRQGILIDALQRFGPGLAQDGRGAHPCGVLHVGRVVHCAASGQTAGGKQGRQDQGGTFLVFQ